MVSEKEIKRWLVDHYRSMKKLTQARIKKFISLKNKFPYLKAPVDTRIIYRGKKNVSEAQLALSLKGIRATDREVYWTTSQKIAEDFALGKNTTQLLIPGTYAVIIIGEIKPENTLLNSYKIAKLSGVGDYYNKIWGENLSKAIKNEKEIVVTKPVKIKRILYKKITEKDLEKQKKLIGKFYKL